MGVTASTAAEWGDIPGWLSAVVSFLTLVFAAIAATAAARVYRIESARDRANEKRSRRAQAGQVSAWWDRTVVVRNASKVPVYQVHATVLDHRSMSERAKVSLPILPPTSDDLRLSATVHDNVGGTDTVSGNLPRERRVRLTFTDASGIRWMRDEYGRLRELCPSLTFWTHDRFADVLAPLVDDIQAAYGVTARFVDHDFADYTRLVRESGSTVLPEVLIAPHDWCGRLASSGKFAPLLLSDDDRRRFHSWTLDALTFDGSLYGVPCAVDTVVLLRNLDLTPDPPATLEELIATGRALQQAGRVAEVLALQVGHGGDPYHLWPLFTSAGGRLFGRRRDGGWDPCRIRVDSPGSIDAFDRIRSLGEAGAGVLRRDIDESRAMELFTRGRCAYLVSSYWATKKAHVAGIRVRTSALPGFQDGQRPWPFVTVNGLFVSRRSLDRMIAQDMVPDYLTRAYAFQALSGGIDAPPPLVGAEPADDGARTILRECLAGQLMPSFPAMAEVWKQLAAAQAEVIAGALARPVARRLAKELASLPF